MPFAPVRRSPWGETAGMPAVGRLRSVLRHAQSGPILAAVISGVLRRRPRLAVSGLRFAFV